MHGALLFDLGPRRHGSCKCGQCRSFRNPAVSFLCERSATFTIAAKCPCGVHPQSGHGTRFCRRQQNGFLKRMRRFVSGNDGHGDKAPEHFAVPSAHPIRGTPDPASAAIRIGVRCARAPVGFRICPRPSFPPDSRSRTGRVESARYAYIKGNFLHDGLQSPQPGEPQPAGPTAWLRTWRCPMNAALHYPHPERSQSAVVDMLTGAPVNRLQASAPPFPDLRSLPISLGRQCEQPVPFTQCSLPTNYRYSVHAPFGEPASGAQGLPGPLDAL